MIRLPAAVDIEEGKAARLEVGFVRPAEVRGRVRLFEYNPEAPLQAREEQLLDRGGARAILLELYDGEVRRRVTDADGRFRFGELRPGRWTLRVLNGLPEGHTLRPDSVVMDLSPGTSHEVEFRLVPVRRPVQIVAEAELVAEAPPVDSAALMAKRMAEAAAQGRTLVYVVSFDDIGLMNIARYVYGRASFWPRIWIANRDLIPDPDHIEAGMVLRLPPPGPLTPEEVRARDAYRRTHPDRR